MIVLIKRKQGRGNCRFYTTYLILLPVQQKFKIRSAMGIQRPLPVILLKFNCMPCSSKWWTEEKIINNAREIKLN